MIRWYQKYRAKKTIAKKMREASQYIRPGYNIKLTIQRIVKIDLEIKSLQELLK